MKTKQSVFSSFAVLIIAMFVSTLLTIAGCDTGSGPGSNGGDGPGGNGGGASTVSSFAELKSAVLNGGTKTIQLAAGNYPANSGLFIQNGSNITILPPSTGTATIKVDASVSATFISIGENATLTLGKEGADAYRLVIDGNTARNPSNPIVNVFREGARFIMEDGVSLINNRMYGAVMVDKGTFEMRGGRIADNRTMYWGAGVSITEGHFIMEGGLISGNTAESSGEGGGVSVGSSSKPTQGRFTMKGGVIRSNTAGGYGGGVYVWSKGIFIMEGGTIYGYSAGSGDSNKAGSSNTNGAAIYVQSGGIAKDGNDFVFPQATNVLVTR